MFAVLGDVLDLSKIESGKMDVFIQAFDVDAMVQDIAATVDSLVRKKGNTLQVEVEAKLERESSGGVPAACLRSGAKSACRGSQGDDQLATRPERSLETRTRLNVD